jgi:hypothetical protein
MFRTIGIAGSLILLPLGAEPTGVEFLQHLREAVELSERQDAAEDTSAKDGEAASGPGIGNGKASPAEKKAAPAADGGKRRGRRNGKHSK